MKRKTISIFISILMTFSLFSNAFAAENMNAPKATAILINSETGEKTYLDVKQIDRISYNSTGKSVVEYEVFAPLPNPNVVIPLDSKGDLLEEAGVTARAFVEYYISSDGEEIQVESCSGSWEPSDSIYYLTDREYMVTDDYNTARGYPTSNSFERNLEWPYVQRNFVSEFTGPRMTTVANAHVSGMDGSHQLWLFFNFGNR